LDRHFSKEDMQIANSYMKKCPTLLTIEEMEIKTTIIYHLIPVSMTIIKKKKDNKDWQECEEKVILVSC
jgi:hypothetical protein